jgi:hypothetical protein
VFLGVQWLLNMQARELRFRSRLPVAGGTSYLFSALGSSSLKLGQQEDLSHRVIASNMQSGRKVPAIK